MNDPKELNPPSKGQFLVYPSEDGRVKIEVRLENETVWLTQQHMAELFQTTHQNISLHLQNIYEEGKLQRGATHKESLLVRLGNLARESVVKESLTTEVKWWAHNLEKTIAGNSVEMLEK